MERNADSTYDKTDVLIFFHESGFSGDLGYQGFPILDCIAAFL